jgi:hypothetical protein
MDCVPCPALPVFLVLVSQALKKSTLPLTQAVARQHQRPAPAVWQLTAAQEATLLSTPRRIMLLLRWLLAGAFCACGTCRQKRQQ